MKAMFESKKQEQRGRQAADQPLLNIHMCDSFAAWSPLMLWTRYWANSTKVFEVDQETLGPQGFQPSSY